MSIKKFILDTIFPIQCLGCKKWDQWLCDNCLEKIILKKEQCCPLCKKIITPSGETCFNCKYKTALDGMLVASFYKIKRQRTLLGKIIHSFKYRFIIPLHTPLSKILEKSLLDSHLPLPEIIIPVPLHGRRLRWRGFNQSLLMAQYLGDHLAPGLEILVLKDSLIRQRYTLPQMQIKNRQQRISNVAQAFIFNQNKFKRKLIRDKIILLVDDVSTTGSTLFECAQVLKKCGAKKVYSVVLARQ